jgi:NTE family protein
MRALVLSGGGSKGAYEVGVLKKWMAEDGVDYDLIAGISVGALNAAVLCQAPKGSPKVAWGDLNRFWLDVDTSKVRKSWWPFGMASALWKPSVYNSEPLHKWVRSSLDVEKIRSSGRMLRILAVSWDSGESRTVDETEMDILSWVLASSAFPGMFLPVKVEGELWADGALRSVTPLGEAVRAGATEIDVILCTDPRLPAPFKCAGKSALPDLALRAVNLLINEVMRDDLKICDLRNAHADYRKVTLRVLKPKIDLGTIAGDGLTFEPGAVRELIELGYEDACALGRGAPPTCTDK